MSDKEPLQIEQTGAPTRREILLEWLNSPYVVYPFVLFCLLNLGFTASYYVHYYVTEIWYMTEAAEMTSPGIVAVDGLLWVAILLMTLFPGRIKDRIYSDQ